VLEEEAKWKLGDQPQRKREWGEKADLGELLQRRKGNGSGESVGRLALRRSELLRLEVRTMEKTRRGRRGRTEKYAFAKLANAECVVKL
jgi:hypothetical protein